MTHDLTTRAIPGFRVERAQTTVPLARLRAGADTRAPSTRAIPTLIMVGASTGGPQALMTLIEGLTGVLPLVPICVTLHMPADLMPVIAAHVSRVCRVPAQVVTRRTALVIGSLYFAAGDHHCGIERTERGIDILPISGSASDYCRPAVDVMFASGAVSHGARALGVVLSGMGKDGLAGATTLVNAGGCVIVQDKDSSAVWGMPGVIAKAGLASAVGDPRSLAAEVVQRLQPVGVAR